MHACRAAITVATTAGLLLLGPTAWADGTPTPDPSATTTPATTPTATPTATAAPTAQPTADATAEPTDAPTDDATPTDDPSAVPVDNQGEIDPRIYEAGLPVGAVQKHVQKPELPFTGAPVGTLTAGGLALIALGGASILIARRRTPAGTS